MFWNNRIYGNAAAINRYLGRSPESKIWGEIQHSLGLNENTFKDSSGPRFIQNFFTWNRDDVKKLSLISSSRWKFSAIGDPFLYQLFSMNNTRLFAPSRELLIPGHDRGFNIKQLISSHTEFLRQVLISNMKNPIVSLHPGAINITEIRKLYENYGISIANRTFLFDQSYLEKEIDLLMDVSEVFTDYIGPTLFRAIKLGSTGKILSNSEFKEPNLSQIFGLEVHEFNRNLPKQREITDRKLGERDFRSKYELSSLIDSNLGVLATYILAQLKTISMKNYGNIYFSKNIEHMNAICTKCIYLSKLKIREGESHCGKCGNRLKDWDDFECRICQGIFKMYDLPSHSHRQI